MKRVNERINRSSSLAYKCFNTIAYAIPKANKKEHVDTLFQTLSGSKPLSEALAILPPSNELQEYATIHNPTLWELSKTWCNWWARPNHLSKSPRM